MINTEWSKGFNTNGGVQDIKLYNSPYSNNESYNSRQGRATNGVLLNEFEPPTLDVKAPVASAVYTDRLDMTRVNDAVINGKTEEEFRVKRKPEKYGIPGLKDSHMIAGSFPVEGYKKPVKKERFTQEDTRSLIVIIIAIISLCIVGFTFGVLVPKVKINHKVKMVEAIPKKDKKKDERAEAF